MRELGYADGGLLVLAMSDTDALWLGRALVGEEGASASHEAYRAVASCLCRRWIQVQQPRARSGGALLWPTFTHLIRAYCQPVNPAWEARGTAAQIERRALIRSMRWDELPPAAQRVALGMCSGELSLTAPAAVHFADGPTSAHFMANNPGSAVVSSAAKNVLISTAASRRDPEVTTRPAASCLDRMLRFFRGPTA